MPAPDDVADLIRSRRTIADFKSDLPPEPLIREAIELARWAPNHKLTEPWRFHLIGPETKARIVEINTAIVTGKKGPEAGEAKRMSWSRVPGWIAVTCHRDADPLTEREDYAACACAIQNLSLFLWANGIGSKWISGPATRHEDMPSLLGYDPAERSLVGLIWYGYPAHVPHGSRKLDGDAITARLP
jgi:nitroreductase